MFKEKEDRIRILGPALLTVIWFLLLNVLLQNSIEIAHTGAFLYQIENIRKSPAPSNNSTHLYSLPVSLSTISETNFRISNEHLNLLSYNRLIAQRIITFFKVKLLFTTSGFQGFYYHNLNFNNEDLPVLS
jgi:hypothetical protein